MIATGKPKQKSRDQMESLRCWWQLTWSKRPVDNGNPHNLPGDFADNLQQQQTMPEYKSVFFVSNQFPVHRNGHKYTQTMEVTACNL